MTPEISFHNLTPSQAISNWIRRKAEKLGEINPRLVGCKVTVEEPNHHHRQGKGRHFRVRVELLVPGERLVADREAPAIVSHENVYLAIAKTFEAARRQLDAVAPSKSRRSRKTRNRPWLEERYPGPGDRSPREGRRE